MVLYFSPTGNSHYVAKKIAEKTGSRLINIGQLMKNEEGDMKALQGPVVFVAPVYAWRIPRAVEKWIENAVFTGVKEVYFVLTCGGQTGNAISHVKKLCQNKGWELKGFGEVVMPDNYIVMFPSIDKKEAAKVIKKAEPVAEEIATAIAKGESFFTYNGLGLMGKFFSGPLNPMFYRLFVGKKGFYSTNKCIGCGKCAALCPLNNIAMVEGRPVWGRNCTHCMACINRCPTKAVEYKNKAKGKTRYYFEAIAQGEKWPGE